MATRLERGFEMMSVREVSHLVVDTALETSGAPVDELDGALGLNGGDGSINVLGDDVTAVHEAARHVLAVAGVALGHHGSGLEGLRSVHATINRQAHVTSWK